MSVTDRFHWTWYGANQTNSCEVTMSVEIWVLHRNSCRGPMGQWVYRCTARGQVSSIKLEMAQMSPIVVDFQLPQKFGCPTRMPGPDGPDRLITTPLPVYGPRQFHRTWDGVNLPSRCGITVSVRSGLDGRWLFYSPPHFPSEKQGTTMGKFAVINNIIDNIREIHSQFHLPYVNIQ